VALAGRGPKLALAVTAGVGAAGLVAWRTDSATLPLAVAAAVVVVIIAGLAIARRRPAPAVAQAPRSADADAGGLASLGLETETGELKAACARVARRIHAERIRVVGFVPTEDHVAVPPILIQLGIALTELTGATIAVVDANVRYPGLGELSAGRQTDSDESVFSTRWLRGSLALLSAPRVEHAGQVVPQLARVLLDGAELFAHVLVDLTGFELLGEHASAAACMDAVALVGRAHHTRERAVVELAQLMPERRFLGVLLVG
jgi:hypothetical protein